MEPTQHIEITPGVCSGRPRVAGTRIRVENVVRWTERGISADDIIAAYPQLTLADVHAALAYDFDNREEIEGQIRADAEFVNLIKARQRSRAAPVSTGPSADVDPLPS